MKKPIIITGTAESKPIVFENKNDRIENSGSDLGIKPAVNGLNVLALTEEFENPAVSQESNTSSTYEDDEQSHYALIVNGEIFSKTGVVNKIAEAIKSDPKFKGMVQIVPATEDVDFPVIVCTDSTAQAVINFKPNQSAPIRLGFLNETTNSTIAFDVHIGTQSIQFAINNNQEVVNWMNANGLWLMDPEPYFTPDDNIRLPLVLKAMGKDRIKFFIGTLDTSISIAERVGDVTISCGGLNLEQNIVWGCLENRLSNPPTAASSSMMPVMIRNFEIKVSGVVSGVVRYTNKVPGQSRRIDFYTILPEGLSQDIWLVMFRSGIAFTGMCTFEDVEGQSLVSLDIENPGADKLEIIFEATSMTIDSETGNVTDNPNVVIIEGDKPIVNFILQTGGGPT